MDLTDTRYEVDNGLAWITIDRPERMNAFRARTVDELIALLQARVGRPREVGVVCLTGAGDRAFCAGGDQKQRAETGDYGPTESGLFEVEQLHRLIREIPKPVIAAVNGVAIGGGHVLHVLCDLTIAADTAIFGQVGPRVGSFDAGFGTAYLARVVGEKRAREIWFLCRRYDAETAERWGLVNEVVPLARSARRGAPLGRRDAGAVPDGAAVAQAVVQRRHRAPRRHRGAVVQRARAVLRDRGVPRGRTGVHRGPPAGLLAVSRSGVELCATGGGWPGRGRR